MPHLLVVERSYGRVVFVQDTALPELLDALWPSLAYSYVIWESSLDAAVISTPWKFIFRSGTFLLDENLVDAEAKERNAVKGKLLTRHCM
jgi:hypothetical protein